MAFEDELRKAAEAREAAARKSEQDAAASIAVGQSCANAMAELGVGARDHLVAAGVPPQKRRKVVWTWKVSGGRGSGKTYKYWAHAPESWQLTDARESSVFLLPSGVLYGWWRTFRGGSSSKGQVDLRPLIASTNGTQPRDETSGQHIHIDYSTSDETLKIPVGHGEDDIDFSQRIANAVLSLTASR